MTKKGQLLCYIKFYETPEYVTVIITHNILLRDDGGVVMYHPTKYDSRSRLLHFRP